MNKSLEQIQEENREFIIMANNPTAKSYEEALEMEIVMGKGCQVLVWESPFSPKHKKLVTATILWDTGDDRFYCYKEAATFTIIKQDCIIIGKPLTLSRVLIALRAIPFRHCERLTLDLQDSLVYDESFYNNEEFFHLHL